MAYHSLQNQPESGLEVSSAGLEVAPSNDPIHYTPDHASPQAVEAYEKGPYPEYGGDDGRVGGSVEPGQKSTICGLRKPVFWTVVVIAVLIIAAGVGGGIGGALGSSDDSAGGASSGSNDSSTSQNTPPSSSTTSKTTSSNTQSSTTSSSSAAVTSGTTGIAPFSCRNRQTYDTPQGYGFRAYCQTDLVNVDVFKYVTTYSFEECIEQCAKNVDLSSSSESCQGLTYNANLTSSIAGQGGNCFLKAAAGQKHESGDIVASALLET